MGKKPRPIEVEIVAKAKGCVLCDLAVAMLEEIQADFKDLTLTWKIVDVGSREGLRRQAELGGICGRMPPVPSIVVNERIAFDHIPDIASLTSALRSSSPQS